MSSVSDNRATRIRLAAQHLKTPFGESTTANPEMIETNISSVDPSMGEGSRSRPRTSSIQALALCVKSWEVEGDASGGHSETLTKHCERRLKLSCACSIAEVSLMRAVGYMPHDRHSPHRRDRELMVGVRLHEDATVASV
jgi:hypothetical protein